MKVGPNIVVITSFSEYRNRHENVNKMSALFAETIHFVFFLHQQRGERELVLKL